MLAGAATGVLPPPLDQAASAFGLFYGVPTRGFATVWMVLAAALTVRTARQKLPFSLTWWSFTFPVGTIVTGASALSARSDAELFTVASVVLYLLLLTAWMTVANPNRTRQLPRVPLPAQARRAISGTGQEPVTSRTWRSWRRHRTHANGIRKQGDELLNRTVATAFGNIGPRHRNDEIVMGVGVRGHGEACLVGARLVVHVSRRKRRSAM